MPGSSRETKIFAVLLVSMITCAIVLMALGNNPPPAGAFCLNNYYQLDPVEKATASQVPQFRGGWNAIEIYYSGTETGSVEQPAPESGTTGRDALDCHFCLCNGRGGADGQIQSTEKWQQQLPLRRPPARLADTTLREDNNSRTSAGVQTIYICLIADGKKCPPTDNQLRRLQALVELLCRNFDIDPQRMHYPDNWH
ncbi:MAG: peptidoglycan recognition protein family protein [Planctomycetota bacterium]|jgi:hypothetical protein